MRPGDQLMIDFSRRVNDQTQALLADRPGEPVRTATAPDLRNEQDVAPMPQPIYQDRPGDVPPGEFDRETRHSPAAPRSAATAAIAQLKTVWEIEPIARQSVR